MEGLFRRGGVWWARLAVPARLRAQAGRREFVQSTGAHDYSIGKLVAAVMLAGWRRQLFEWEKGKLDNEKLLRLAEGTRRPQLDACLAHLREGDTLHVHSMDRLARNVDDLRRLVKDLTARDVVVRFHKEGLVFTGEDSPMANLLLSMLGAVAEFERALILERQREGIAVAKAQGVYKGRKPSLVPARADELRARAAAGENKSKLAREFGISRDTLYAYLRAEDQAHSSESQR